jgi:signal transduction histidine kinase
MLERGTPVSVDDATIAFIVWSDPGGSLRLRGEERAYLQRTNQALLLATVGAVLVAVLLGAIFARTLTRPIRDLTDTAQALRQGHLGQQVRVRSQDELGQLASTFNQMSADLERATRARRQMTADIAHDLRTPLQVIGGYIDAMVEGDLEPTRERLATVYTEIEHLQHLVADLRILSRADAGNLPLHLQPVAPADLLHRVAASYTNQAAQQAITLTINAAPDLPPLCIDEERMVQVLNNLVSNALRHTPADGHIALTAEQHDAAVCLTVQDTGTGIAPDDLPYLFDRFYRVEQARQDDAGTSGLGLAIAKALVEAHSGTISARSHGPDQGAAFLILLPNV